MGEHTDDSGRRADSGTFAGISRRKALGGITAAGLGVAAQAAISAVSVGDLTASDAVALAADLASNSTVRAESGTYILSGAGVTVPPGKKLVVGAGSKLQLAGALRFDSAIRAVTLGAGSSFIGEVDCNRAGQDRAAFNASVGMKDVSIVGIEASGSAESPVAELNVDARITGCADLPASFFYVNDSHIRIRASGCGGAVVFNRCDNLRVDIEVDDADNDGWRVFPHAVDFINCTRISGRVVIRGQKGTGRVAAGTALSDWFSGVTILRCSDMQFDEIDAEAADLSGQSKGLGVSILGTSGVNCSRTRIVGYSDGLLELGGVVDSTFAGLNLDGRYAVSGESDSAGYGVTLVNNAFNDTITARTLECTRNVKFLPGTITRCLDNAINLQAAVDTTWFGVSASSSLNGLNVKFANQDVGDGPAPSDGALSGHRFIGCDFSFNERNGVRIFDAVDITFQICRANNNSQAGTYGSTRRGLVAATDAAGFGTVTSTNKSGLLFDGCQADDLQGSVASGFPDPSRTSVVAADKVERYGVGQTVTVEGAGEAGADLLTRINGINHDELTLESEMKTVPIATLAGTISTTGSAISGTGTAFNTDLVGRAYIKVGSNYRRIAKVASDTSATLEAAFPSDVAGGTALTIVRVMISAERSQPYGYLLTEDAIAPAVTNAKAPTGNISSQIANLTASETPLRYQTTGAEVPVAADASGVVGEWAADANYFYVCVAANTWVRTDLASW